MAWGDHFSLVYGTVEGSARRAREKASQEREKAEQEAKAAADRAAYLRDEEAICYRLIRSSVERERCEGYTRHIVFLATKHGIRMYPQTGVSASASVSQ